MKNITKNLFVLILVVILEIHTTKVLKGLKFLLHANYTTNVSEREGRLVTFRTPLSSRSLKGEIFQLLNKARTLRHGINLSKIYHVQNLKKKSKQIPNRYSRSEEISHLGLIGQRQKKKNSPPPLYSPLIEHFKTTLL